MIFDSHWSALISSFISVTGGVLASFLVALLIDLFKTTKEKNMVINIVNEEVDSVVFYTNYLFEEINRDYYNGEKMDIYNMCSAFPFKEFDLEKDVCLSILVCLSLLTTSVENIRDIDKKYNGCIIKSESKECWRSFYEGLMRFREACMYKSEGVGKVIGTMISELSCDLYFFTRIPFFEKEK